MGKLMSLETADTGSLWMVITGQAEGHCERAVTCSLHHQKILTEVIGNHQEALERFLGFTDEVNEIL